MLRILRRSEVEAATGLRKSRLDELERRGDFPQRVRISARATGWRSDEVEQWIASRPRASEVDADSSERLRATSHQDRAKGSMIRAKRAAGEGAA